MADKTGDTSTLPAKAATARASQQVKLQTSLGQAMMHSRGYASDRSTAAFARAPASRTELATRASESTPITGCSSAVCSAVTSSWRGRRRRASCATPKPRGGRRRRRPRAQLGPARLFRRFHRWSGELAEALRIYDSERDRDAKFRFSTDDAASAAGYLALAIWALGDVDRARALGEEALALADESVTRRPGRSFTLNLSLPRAPRRC